MRSRSLGVAAMLLVACAALAQAEPVQFHDVSAKAVWLAHVDVDAARSSTVMKKGYEACVAGGKLAECFDKMAKECGMDPRKDVHGLTLYGTKIVPGQGVLIVRAEMDQAQLVEKAAKSPGHRKIKHRDHEIHTWTSKKGCHEHTLAGTFYKPNVLVLASGADLLKTALDVLDGRAASLEAGQQPLAADVPQGTIFLARAADIASSKMGERVAFCSQLKTFDYAEGERKDKWFGHVRITADNEQTAGQLRSVLDGFRAVVWLSVESAPKLQQILDLVKVVRDENAVALQFEAPAEKVAAAMPAACELLKKHLAKHRKMADDCKKQQSAPKAKPAKMKSAKTKSSEKEDKPNRENKPDGKDAKPKKSQEGAKADADDRSPMHNLTARQATGILGIVVGKPLDAEAAEVVRVWGDSPAEKAGLKPGDRIVKADGEKIGSPEALRGSIVQHKPGEEVDLIIRRDGKQQEITVRLAGGDDFGDGAGHDHLHRVLSPRPWLGVEIGLGIGRGVSVASVLPGSPAERAGLEKGDSILRVDKTRVEAPADLQVAIAGHRPGETVRLVILRNDARQKIEVELGAFGILQGESRE